MQHAGVDIVTGDGVPPGFDLADVEGAEAEPVVMMRASRYSLAELEAARAAAHEATPRVTIGEQADVELTPWMRGALDAMRAGAEPPCPYGSGVHRASHEILARREWQLPLQNVPIVLRAAAVLVSGGAGDYAAYMAIADDDAWIADHGIKLGFTEAALLFPGIVQRRYRP